MRLPRHFICLILVLSLFSCAEEQQEKDEVEKHEIPELAPVFDINDSLIVLEVNSMSNLDKLCQLLHIESELDVGLSFGGLINSPNFLNDSIRFKPLRWRSSIFDVFDEVPCKHNWDRKRLSHISDTVYIDTLVECVSMANNDLGSSIIIESDSVSFFFNQKVERYLSEAGILRLNSDTLTDELVFVEFADSARIIENHQIGYFIKDSIGHSTSELKDNFNSMLDGAVLSISSKEELNELNKTLEKIANSPMDWDFIDYKVKKMLALRKWLHEGKKLLSPKEFESKWIIDFRNLIYKSHYKSIAAINNSKNVLPINKWPDEKWTFSYVGSKQGMKSVKKGMSNYNDISAKRFSNLNAVSLNAQFQDNILILNNQELDSSSWSKLSTKIKEAQNNVIIVNVGIESNLSFLRKHHAVIHTRFMEELDYELLGQALVGGNKIDGRYDSTNVSIPKTRLSYTIAEEVGIHSDSLKEMKKIAQSAIWARATPGCQVFAAIDGKVIFDKAFGYTTYDHEKLVTRNTVYDVASMTKVAATTVCGMKMYQDGKYEIFDSLKSHFSDTISRYLGHPSRLRNLTFHQLYTHTSGLPSGLPIYKFIAYVDSVIGKFDRYYCDESNSYYCVEVAKDFYLDSAYLDSLWVDMHRIWPGNTKYKYSDANMNILYHVLKSKTGSNKRYNRYLDEILYDPMNLEYTTFLPNDYLDTNKVVIAPTEFDTFWRYQLLKGYVHDPNAAIYGGVAGNAGLFSTAHELGILFQMMMRGGNYGGLNYVTPTTMKRFSRHQEGSHRGLGFDKPTASSGSYVARDCPYTAYGHTGFTGICGWNDPENKYSFVFVSNRVHPDPGNKKLITMGIRRKLHQVVYDQLKYRGTYKNSTVTNPEI